MRKVRYWLVILLSILLVACRQQPASVTQKSQQPDLHTLQTQTFEALWQTVNDNFVYEDFGGVNWENVREQYASRLEEDLSAEAFAELMREMVSELPETAVVTYQTREERIQQALDDTGANYEGIGAFVSVRENPEARVILLSIMPNSPAEKAGLQPHDSILAVDGISIADILPEEHPVMRVRGPAGTDVTLTVRPPGGIPRDVVVTRGAVTVTPGKLQVTRLADTIAYVLFPPVPYANMVNDLLATLDALNTEATITGLILDLRIATTSNGWPIDDLLSLFGNGRLGEIYTRTDTTPITVTGTDTLNSQQIPLAIIVGPDTSGTPELFAAALQSIKRATIIGQNTTGELEGFTPFFLPDGSRVFVPTSSYRTPDLREIGLLGVMPDIPIQADWDEVTDDNDPVRAAAVTVLQPEQE
ncbi:MAG: PDZ domain-containing protein [Chloroflexi bacterium]|nr:MAG: PDZ domain-containing protein [Chloroflexota bacterium]